MVKLPEKYKMLKVMQKLKNFNRSISAKVFDDMVNDLSLKKKNPKAQMVFQVSDNKHSRNA